MQRTAYADRVKDITLDLPIYGSLSEEEVCYICDVIRKHAE